MKLLVRDPIVVAARATAAEVLRAYPDQGPVLVFDGIRSDPIVLAFVRDDPSPDGVLFVGNFPTKEDALAVCAALDA